MSLKPIQEVIAYWDKAANHYDGEFGGGISGSAEHDIYKSIIVKSLSGTNGTKVLDVGCGTGEISIIFAGLGFEVAGIDVSDKMLAHAIEKNRQLGLDILFAYGDAENPPFKEHSFDVVFSRHLIWTLTDPGKAVVNWIRLLKPGGILLAIDGVWIHKGFEPSVRRLLANIIVSIKKLKIHRGWTNYYAADKNDFPLFGGTGAKSIMDLFKRYDLMNIWTDPLDELISFEHKHAPLEYRILYTKNPRYLVGGVKKGE